jgi:diguanylate cyclase (GGDEF)-like protein/PAS domain S-box-containing protein
VVRCREGPGWPVSEPADLAVEGGTTWALRPEELPAVLLRAVDTAGDGITIADARAADSPLIYVNEAFLTLTGYTRDQTLGRNCRFLQGADTDTAQVRDIGRRLAAEREVHVVLRNYRRNGTAFWNELRVTPVHDRAGHLTHFIGHQRDVSARVDREQRTTYLAYHDELTGLPNRAHAMEHLELELRRADRSGSRVGVLILDLDGFKQVNDTYGHAAGDEVLRAAGHRLRGAVRAGDLIARLGGDEFLVVLAGLPPATTRPGTEAEAALGHLAQVRRHLRDALAGSLALGPARVQLAASIGAATYPEDGADAAALLAHADAAMYVDKRPG